MKYKSRLLLFFIFIFTVNGFSQNTFFIKYKNSIDKPAVEEKIRDNKLFPDRKNFSISNSNYKISYFAKGLGKDLENISRIIKITFAGSGKRNNYFTTSK